MKVFNRVQVMAARPADKRLALCYADAVEKLICWDVFDRRQAVSERATRRGRTR